MLANAPLASFELMMKQIAAPEVEEEHDPRLTIKSPEQPQPRVKTSSPTLSGKRRRKTPIADTLNESTAVQRLAEYFVVVSSIPRWESRTRRGIERSNSKSTPKPSSLPKAGRSWDEATSPLVKPPSEQSLKRDDSNGNIHVDDTDSGHDYFFRPKITARYPVEDHQDNPLNPMILHFCYPSGDTIVPSRSYEIPRVHHFVLTNDRGRKVYGTCLTILEEYHPTADGPWTSQAMTQEEISGDGGIEVQVDRVGQALYIPKILCILSTWPYLTAFREYLAQLYRLATATNVMEAPIERYVLNLCREVPAPPPGAYEVQLPILNSTIRFWAPPAKLPIAYVGLPYKTLFECLDLENLLTVWSGLIMERKVLLLSSQYSILTVCSEVLCSLLFPFRWSHLYVPMLPRLLCPILDAPVPYLCGVVRENWLHAEQFVGEDTIIVDLDRNCVKFGDAVSPIPQRPTKKWAKLQTSLAETAGHVYWRAHGLEREYRATLSRKAQKRSLETLRKNYIGRGEQWMELLNSLDHAYNLAYTPDSANLLGDSLSEDEQSQWNLVQESFLRFFVALLKPYRGFLSIPSGRGGTPRGGKPSFDIERFVSSQHAENVPFLTEMCMTQHFDDFLTRRMYSPGEPDLVFFDESIDAKINRSKLKIRKLETPLLQSAKVHKELTKLRAVEPNLDGLGGTKESRTFVYKKWPESFDESLFSEPRPIPFIISAEFDRQAMLVSKLRAHFLEDQNNNQEYFADECDPSPEVAAFTVFFFVYSAVVGLEWQKYTKQLKEDTVKSSSTQMLQTAKIEEGREVGVEAFIREFLSEEDEIGYNECLADVTLGLCTDGLTTLLSYNNCIQTKTEEKTRSIADELGVDFPWSSDSMAKYEEAREVACAQLDLAFETLATMSLRNLPVDSDAYLSLMEACGRCGDTQRALKLMQLMKKDGFAADSEILSRFMAAFSHEEAGGLEIGPPFSDFKLPLPQNEKKNDAYSRYLEEKLEAVKQKEARDEENSSFTNDEGGGKTSDSESDDASPSKQPSGPVFLDWFSQKRMHRKPRRKRKRRQTTINCAPVMPSNLPVTSILASQQTLGDSLLDFLYPKLIIQTNRDSCPQCSYTLSESDVVVGWKPCSFRDFTTKCPKCSHRFVPQFVVSCASPDFEGSQGLGTPLYCEFLSPWVIRKELQSVIKGETGIEGMLDPEWRGGTDIRATLFWNMMVLYRRYRLPFSFLFQGSFHNRLVLPKRPDEM